MANWLITIKTLRNWQTCREHGIWGAPRDLSRYVKPGDTLIIYCSEVKAFIAVCKVVSEWYREDKPLWPDEIKEGKIKYPNRVRIEVLKEGHLPVLNVLDKLTFIKPEHKELKRWGIYFMGTLANFRRPIPDQDLELVMRLFR